MFKSMLKGLEGKRSGFPLFFLSKREKESIVSAIRRAEKKTSGEIRVHLCRRAPSDIQAHARKVFEKLGMTHTQRRNGVLVFIATRDRSFAVLADRGIHERLDPAFLEDVAGRMREHFRQNRFSDGVVAAVEALGEQLRRHFPAETGDVNELPDRISYSL
ncbi:MAG: TPM domain-containing protein [Candidatus Omnitrophota bacterium]|jgi:uncharacterized membrane protein